MKLGLALSPSVTTDGGAAVFDPATLALTGWWRASYAASPWTGTASAGTSLGRDLTEATNPPAAGTAVNGRTPADFDGTDDELQIPGTIATYFNADAYSFWVLVNIDAIDTDGGNHQDDMIFGQTAGSRLWLTVRSTGPVVKLGHFDGAGYVTSTRTIATATWLFIQGRYNGTDQTLRVNGGTRDSNAGAVIDDLTGAMRVGRSSFDAYLNGKILDLGFSDQIFSNEQEDSILSYARAYHGLALT